MPTDVPLVAPARALAYHHVARVTLAREMTPLQAWWAMQARPLPGLALAFRLRDAISARFGVKRIGGFSGDRPTQVAAGDRLDFFLVEEARPDLLVLTERDRHLDVMTCLSTEGRVFTVTSSVKVHNAFGRLYMIPVGLAHRVIVAAMLRRLPRA
ncbi:DUF2867 domain-containing protein [Pseudooceanicola sp. 200-1SW]|uniref:DUF2867 domain-containing protein n=1 Tax=Pseudooceanicola sp. 200-1SW TaxID=3425949 RepID=UPI003D7F5D39